MAPRMTRLDDPSTPRNLYNAVISACEQSSRWQEAWEFMLQHVYACCGHSIHAKVQALACCLLFFLARLCTSTLVAANPSRARTGSKTRQ